MTIVERKQDLPCGAGFPREPRFQSHCGELIFPQNL
jgi:hypothetical protein